MRTLRLRVTMREVAPRVERVIDVPAGITLDELHPVLQAAVGWTDSHLHQFRTDDTVYTMPMDGWDDDEVRVDERGVPLSKLPSALVYAYDLGDGWEHDVRVEAIEDLGTPARAIVCVEGARACPPDDVGGPGGYEHFLAAIADPDHEEHDHLLEWCGGGFDPEAFSVRAVNARLAGG